MTRKNLYTKAEMMLREYMGMHRMHCSEERLTILRTIVNKPGSFTAKDVEEMVKKCYISRATVYNTLQLFEQAHIVQCLHVQHNGRLMQYELALGEQSTIQIVCTKCGRIQSVSDKATQTAVYMKNYPNFIMRHYSLYVFGECKTCKKLITKL